jgi:hypothetical protein
MATALDAARSLQDQYGVPVTNSDRRSGSEHVQTSLTTQRWPEPMAEEAYHGLAGDIVRTIQPDTEADPAAVLMNFLVYYGSVVGRGPHAVAEEARHGMNLNVVQVGESSKARKGSANSHVMKLFERVEPEWSANHIVNGLSSGEGLLWAVRDPISKVESVKDGGKVTGEHQTVLLDPGVDDKRLIAIESEFASVLKVMGRDSNTLSALMRQAWDNGTLRTLTKNNPVKASEAHISIIGHITKNELLRYLTDTEMGNGFANRFLWVCTKRAQVLPEGGGRPEYGELVPRLRETIERAREIGEIARDAEAKTMWAGIYEGLSEGKPGLSGSVATRAEAQVLRLSVIYASLDGSTAIRRPHLMAALAVWDYTERSIRYIFGDATGDPIADRILEALADRGELTRTEISYLFKRNTDSSRIATALNLLATTNRADRDIRPPEDGKGRSAEVWKLK